LAGTYREADGRAVPMADAKRIWVDHARDELLATAGRYNALIEYGELAEAVQARSGIRTKMLVHYWIGDVLGRVSRECHRRGEPLLSSLCVHKDGTVGDGYATMLRATQRGTIPADLDMHAAQERFECYRYFGATLPEDGGTPTLSPKVAARRSRTTRRRVAEAPRAVCPTCHLALPATGQCDTCGEA